MKLSINHTGLLLLTFIILFASVFPVESLAHEARPLYVEITERSSLVYAVAVKVPPTVKQHNQPQIVLPNTCLAANTGDGNGVYRIYTCTTPIGGQDIEIRYPLFNPSVSTLLQVSRKNGEQHTILGGPAETVLTIPPEESTTGVAGQYLALGVEHILSGYDHLLFLACLIFVAGTGRRIIVVVTGFTIAHSVTLALAALGILRIPIAPIEAAIALSILFLATEIARAARTGRKDTLTWRHPIAVSASFGLLHGLGFASVLAEIGLPQTQLTTALLFFNLGVEVGQLAFVAVIIGAIVFARRIARHMTLRLMAEQQAPTVDAQRLALPAAYLVGTMSSFWLIERLANFGG